MTNHLRNIFYFPIQPWFVKKLGYSIYDTKKYSYEFVAEVKKILVIKIR